MQRRIATDTESFAYYATKVAPEAAITEHGAATAILAVIQRRLQEFWPDVHVALSG